MAHNHQSDNGHNYLKQRLRDIRLSSDDAALQNYLDGLRKIDHELGVFDPPESDNLKQFGRGNIDLTSSATSLPMHGPAFEAGQKVLDDDAERYYGKLRELKKHSRQVLKDKEFFEHLQRGLSRVDSKMISTMRAEGLLDSLAQGVRALESEQIQSVTNALSAGNKLHPTIRECIAKCRDAKYHPSIPTQPDDLVDLKKQLVKFGNAICDEALCGKYSGKQGVVAKINALRKAIQAEDAQVQRHLQGDQDACIEGLKPVVGQTMEALQGWGRQKIKPENLCIHLGSSTHIMDTALSQLIDKDEGIKRFMCGHSGKKLLVSFTTSWDGLKLLAGDLGMEPSFINGSVDAAALEGHIQSVVLRKKSKKKAQDTKSIVGENIGALVINVPENPIGRMPNEGEMKKLAEVISRYDIPLVAVDEIFAAPGYRSLATYPDMAHRCYTISSTSKNIPHHERLAFGYSDNDAYANAVIADMRKKHSVNPIIGNAMRAMVSEVPPSYYTENQAIYARKVKMIDDEMGAVNQSLGIERGMAWMVKPNYGCLGVVTFPRELTDRCGISTTTQLVEFIYKTAGVKTVPTGDVHPDRTQPLGVRINVSEQDGVLAEAIKRMGVTLSEMQQGRQFSAVAGAKLRGERTTSAPNTIEDVLELLGISFGQGCNQQGRSL